MRTALQGRHFVRRNQTDALLGRLDMNEEENRQEIDDGGDGGDGDDLYIGDLRDGGDDERGRSHDRRHELASRGGGRLHRAGDVGPVARALHQRDGERPRGHHVGDAAAHHRTHEAAGDDRHLGRTATAAAGQGVGELHQEVSAACFLQEGGERDEQKDVGRIGVDDDAEHRHLRGHELQDALQGEPLVGEDDVRKPGSHEGVGHEDQRQDRQHVTQHPPAHLQGNDDQHAADDHVHRRRLAHAFRAVGRVPDPVAGGEHRQRDQEPIDGAGPCLGRGVARRVEEEEKDAGEDQIESPVAVRRVNPECSRVDVEKGENDGDGCHHVTQ